MSSLPIPSLLKYLPLNYNQIYTQQDGQTNNGMDGSGSNQETPRRSLSQSLLSQMASPVAGFGLTRSTSPSPMMSVNALRRTPSFNNRGFMSRGPSLQSLVKSLVNRVSRGTQTDCDDNFDVISIASVTSGFSAIAHDLSQSRLKLFLNDNHNTNYSKSYASSQVDDSEFVEELAKLRGEISGEFGNESNENQFEMDEAETIYEKNKKVINKLNMIQPRILCDQSIETDRIDLKDFQMQTDLIKVEMLEKSCETESFIKLVERITQTSRESSPQKKVRSTNDMNVQTDLLRFCEHCSGAQLNHSPPYTTIIHQEPVIVQQPQPAQSAQPPQIMNCEFIISHADIICKENKLVNDGNEAVQSQPKLESESTNVKEDLTKSVSNEMETKLKDVKESENHIEIDKDKIEPTKEVKENTTELKVKNLYSTSINGYRRPKLVGTYPTKTETNDNNNNNETKKKSKKDKKKSPKKIAIIPSNTDEEYEMKRHQIAMTSTKPKCCTIS